MKLVFETQEDRVTTNQGSHLKTLAGAVLSLAAWNEPEHQETNGRESHLSKSSTVGAQGSFIHHKHITSAPRQTPLLDTTLEKGTFMKD